MRELTPEALAAMWLYGAEYAQQSASAKDFYAALSESRKQTVAAFVAQMRQALAAQEAR